MIFAPNVLILHSPMTNSHFSRRDWLKKTALATTPLLLSGVAPGPTPLAPAAGKTPALTAAEVAAIEAALGKKGTYVAAQATHTTPLPRNDLKVAIKGEPVPISFGFGGGWPSSGRWMVSRPCS